VQRFTCDILITRQLDEQKHARPVDAAGEKV
jgi:hypothetical protein